MPRYTSYCVRLSVALLILLPAAISFTHPTTRKSVTHQWKTGDWESCLSSPSCGEGQRKRSVWCADSEGFKTFELNCDSPKKPSLKESCFKVCDSLEQQLWWHTEDWGPCVAQPHTDSSSKLCKEGSGISVRILSCMYLPEDSLIAKKVPIFACSHFWEKPKSEIGCSYDCPTDCAVSTFTNYTDCGQCNANKTRVRRVIAGPSEGGEECPQLFESISCDPNFTCPKEQFSIERTLTNDVEPLLKVGEWGECLPSTTNNVEDSIRYSYHSGLRQGTLVGEQIRQISCLNLAGEIISIESCEPDRKLRPVRTRICLVPIDCALSPWSEWRVIQEGCINSHGEIRPEIRTRSRNVLRLPQGNGKPCSFMSEERILKDNLPICDKYKWLPLPWTQCNLASSENESTAECGVGRLNRKVICVQTKDLKPVESALCFEVKPLEYKECNVICQRECVVSAWSTWSSCIPLEIKNYLDPPSSGYMKRTRQILVHPTTGECPALQESDPCKNMEVYSWQYGNWSECVPFNNSRCGPGLRSRPYHCVLLGRTQVSEAYCDIHTTLENEEECDALCPGDCVPSQWSAWSACSAPCFDRNQKGIMERKRNIIAHSSPDGADCEEMKEREDCNYFSCVGFSWKAGDWDTCKVKNGADYGEGVQSRRTWCVLNGEDVKEKHCHALPKLPKYRKCEIPRPVDCKVTDFSRWTTCPEFCDPLAKQHRERFIVQNPLNDGKPCPEILDEIRPCFETNDPVCFQRNLTYFWHFGSWSDCVLFPEDAMCGYGLQTRYVICRNSNGLDVEPFNCLENTSDPPLLLSRSCTVDCFSKCITTEWVAQTSCKDNCKEQVMKREVIATNLNGSHCQNKILNKVDLCPPSEIVLDDDSQEWHSCIIESQQEYGIGRQFKRGNNVVNCQQTGIVSRSCELEHPRDCLLSNWSEWSSCNSIHGSGYRTRRRNIIQHPNTLGRPCPVDLLNEYQVEVDVWTSGCEAYRWVAENWNDCIPRSKDKSPKTKICGNNFQNRRVRCYVVKDGNILPAFEESFCNELEKPLQKRSCNMPCPNDCAVSEWTEWSSCGYNCNSTTPRERTRKIIRIENSTDDQPCPILIEKEPCKLGENCYEYEWVLGDWGSCRTRSGAPCGHGTKKRAQMCQRSDGKEVSRDFCLSLPDNFDFKLEVNCSVECAIDCVVTSWSEWNFSSCKPCHKSGVQIRTRNVLQFPTRIGQPCPALLQTKPCLHQACYHWELGPFTKCQMENKSSCGFGMKERAVKCLRSDGIEVEKSLCVLVNNSRTVGVAGWLNVDWLMEAQDVKEEELCHIACPGDCIVSEWSAWDLCHRDCSKGQTIGHQTRSRVILSQPNPNSKESCPRLYEIRPCWSGECLTFNWKVLGEEVKCLRSDGLYVEGGCSGKHRPCVLACVTWGGECDTSTGTCRCPIGSRWYSNPADSAARAANSKSDAHFPKRTAADLLKGRCGRIMDIRGALHNNTLAATTIKFLPDDNEASFWMYAMISVGTAFVIFVAVTVYLMCHSSLRERLQDVRRQGSLRRRPVQVLPSVATVNLNGGPKMT